VTTYGYYAVFSFFVVSGFVIPHAMLRSGYNFPTDAKTFLLRRLMRLEPTYLASIAITLAITFLAARTQGYDGSPFHLDFTQLGLHVAYLIPWSDRGWINPVYWSLAIEFQYYIVMIAAAPLLLSKSPLRRYAILAVTLLLARMATDNRLLFVYLPFFALGFLAFLRHHKRINLGALNFWVFVFAVLCLRVGDVYGMIAGVLTMAAIFVPLSRPVPILSFLGTISYSVYLLHQPLADRIGNLYARLGFSEVHLIAAAATSIAVSIVAATALWWLVERPSADRARLIGRREALVTS
jgi:peptidoglycan/LPS O-acetylase OafA/YrhL